MLFSRDAARLARHVRTGQGSAMQGFHASPIRLASRDVLRDIPARLPGGNARG
jgi:hypothetical protein